MALAFGLHSGEVRALPSRELPDRAAAARGKQRTFLMGKKLAAADVGKALAVYRDGEGAKYSPWNGIPSRIPEQIAKMLSFSTTERETWHLIHIMQGKRHFQRDIVLRGLAHAAILARKSWTTCPQERADLIVRQEDAIKRTFAQSCGRIKALAGSLLQGALAEELLNTCVPRCGVPVLHMKAEMSKDMAFAAERIGEGAILCEWCYWGERCQIHITRGGKVFDVYSRRIRWRTDKSAANEEATRLLSGYLDLDDCILDCILVRSKKDDSSEKPAEPAGEVGDNAKASEDKPSGKVGRPSKSEKDKDKDKE